MYKGESTAPNTATPRAVLSWRIAVFTPEALADIRSGTPTMNVAVATGTTSAAPAPWTKNTTRISHIAVRSSKREYPRNARAVSANPTRTVTRGWMRLIDDDATGEISSWAIPTGRSVYATVSAS